METPKTDDVCGSNVKIRGYFSGLNGFELKMISVNYGSLYVTLCFVLCPFDFGVFVC